MVLTHCVVWRIAVHQGLKEGSSYASWESKLHGPSQLEKDMLRIVNVGSALTILAEVKVQAVAMVTQKTLLTKHGDQLNINCVISIFFYFATKLYGKIVVSFKWSNELWNRCNLPTLVADSVDGGITAITVHPSMVAPDWGKTTMWHWHWFCYLTLNIISDLTHQ